jgi:ribonuclease BN (tRNA processing enzyme)
MRLHLLGTGSPRPDVERASSCAAIEVGDRVYLIDCGERALTRVMEAGIPHARVTRLLFTHLHTDHTFGYGPYVIGGWNLGRRELRVFGPPGTARLHALLFDEAYRDDIAYRRSLGRDLRGLTDVEVREVGEGVVLEEDGLRVTARWVRHNVPTLAYRFDYGGRSIVMGADTVPCDALVELSRGADVLVADCCLDPTTRERYLADPANRPVWERIVQEHCDAAQCGQIATAAGVRRLVLTHLMPLAQDAPILDELRPHFAGETVVARDLMTLEV